MTTYQNWGYRLRGLPIPSAAAQPRVTWALLAINFVVFLLTGGTTDPFLLLDYGAMFGPLIAEGEYWRLFTAMFLHVGIGHLVMNALGLFIFGQLVERLYGPSRFLAIYLLAGLTGSVVSFAFNNVAIGAGASGAIMGIVGALGGFFISQRNLLGDLGRRNLTGVLILAAINLLYGLATPGIDNWAHIGGFVGGFALGIVLAPRYVIADTPLGTPTVFDVSSLAARWWIVPGVVAALLVGTFLASATMPVTAFSHLYQAERYFEDGEYAAALDEVDEAVAIERALPDLYLLRGRIYVELGSTGAAISDFGRAIQYSQAGDPRTRAEAVRLLLEIRTRR